MQDKTDAQKVSMSIKSNNANKSSKKCLGIVPVCTDCIIWLTGYRSLFVKQGL